MKGCNPASQKAKNPAYECNPLTGRWNLRKKSKQTISQKNVKICNPASQKAKNPAYECNPLTGRWNLRKKNRSCKKPNSPDRSQYKLPSFNYRCQKKNMTDRTALETCSLKVKDISLSSLIGEGAHGKVYKATGVYNSKKIDIAVKIIHNANLDEMFDEVNYSYYMSELEIGPQIYDAFFQKKRNMYIQYIIMEPFDGEVESLLRSNTTSIKFKKYAINKMCLLLYRLLFESSLECYDIKPTNFVYKKNGTIKMIDFGSTWCKSNVNETPFHKNIIYLILLIQLAYLVKKYSSNDVSVLNQFNNVPIFYHREKHIKDIENEFYKNHALFQIYNYYVRNNRPATLSKEIKRAIAPISTRS